MPGIEPRLAEPKSAVLPLHHISIPEANQLLEHPSASLL